jgi:hypothetical protein
LLIPGKGTGLVKNNLYLGQSTRLFKLIHNTWPEWPEECTHAGMEKKTIEKEGQPYFG